MKEEKKENSKQNENSIKNKIDNKLKQFKQQSKKPKIEKSETEKVQTQQKITSQKKPSSQKQIPQQKQKSPIKKQQNLPSRTSPSKELSKHKLEIKNNLNCIVEKNNNEEEDKFITLTETTDTTCQNLKDCKQACHQSTPLFFTPILKQLTPLLKQSYKFSTEKRNHITKDSKHVKKNSQVELENLFNDAKLNSFPYEIQKRKEKIVKELNQSINRINNASIVRLQKLCEELNIENLSKNQSEVLKFVKITCYGFMIILSSAKFKGRNQTCILFDKAHQSLEQIIFNLQFREEILQIISTISYCIKNESIDFQVIHQVVYFYTKIKLLLHNNEHLQQVKEVVPFLSFQENLIKYFDFLKQIEQLKHNPSKDLSPQKKYHVRAKSVENQNKNHLKLEIDHQLDLNPDDLALTQKNSEQFNFDQFFKQNNIYIESKKNTSRLNISKLQEMSQQPSMQTLQITDQNQMIEFQFGQLLQQQVKIVIGQQQKQKMFQSLDAKIVAETI